MWKIELPIFDFIRSNFEKCSGHDLNIVDERHSYRQSRRPGIVGRFAPIGNFFSKESIFDDFFFLD